MSCGSSESRKPSRCNFVKHGQTVGDCAKRNTSKELFFWGIARSASRERLFDTVTVVDACGLSVVGLETGCAERRRAAPIRWTFAFSPRARGTENVTFRYQGGKRDGC